MTTVLLAWACWILLQAGRALAVPFTHRNAAGPVTNGLVVVVPRLAREMCTSAELAALVAHEHGHIACGHAAKNFVLRCFFVPRTVARVEAQEFEADDFAATQCDPLILCEALRRLSFNDLDWKRAKRLERIAVARRALHQLATA